MTPNVFVSSARCRQATRKTWSASFFLRNEKWKNEMLTDLGRLLPIQAMPTTEDIQAVLRSRRYDNYEIDGGFAVLDYPFYMNAMLDPLFIDRC